jgi:Anti-sigma factor NepR
MAGKNGSTHHTVTASGAVEEDSGWQPPATSQPGERPGERDECAQSQEDAHQDQKGKRLQSAPERQSTMDSQRPSQDRKAPRGMLDRSLQAQLGRQLRSIYSDIASEPVPERFVKLLEELEDREKRR